jgi:hypothetical protein
MIVDMLLVVAGLGLLIVVVAEYGGKTYPGRALRRIATRQPKSIAELDSYSSLSLEELALVEKYVPQLLSVVILCHRVDEPNSGLAKAVLDNFQQGAAYTFFVSPDEAQDADLLQYQEWFEHIFHAARGAAPASGENAKIRDRSFADVFAIKRLPLMWANVPYVFYTFESEPGEFATITFKGTQPGVGISKTYDRVGATEARAIIDLCSAASAAFCPAIGEKRPELDQPIPDQAISDVKVPSFPRLVRSTDDQTPTPRQWIN